MMNRYRVQAATGSWSGRGLALACVDCKTVVTNELPAQVSLRRLEEAADVHEWEHHATEALQLLAGADVLEIMTAQSEEPIARYVVPPEQVPA